MYPHANVRSSYASQAEKWKSGASTWKSGASTSSSSVSELVLISELCSSVGQSSFPPRETLNTLLRHINTIDHNYICELLESKLEDRLWQVVARALAVLDSLLNTNEATIYLEYFSARQGLFQYLTQHTKQSVRSRAEKIVAMLENYEPTIRVTTPPQYQEQGNFFQQNSPSYEPPMQQQFPRERQSSVTSNADSTRQRNVSVSSVHNGPDLLSPSFRAQRQNTYVPDLLLSTSPRQYQSPPSAPLLFGSPARSTTPVYVPPTQESSAFSFLSNHNTPVQPTHSAFSFVSPPSPSSSSAISYQNEEPSPVQSSVSAFSFVQNSQQTTSFDFLQGSSNHPRRTSESSGFSFLAPKSPTSADRIHDAFADLSVGDNSPDVSLSDFAVSSVHEDFSDGHSEFSEEPPTPPKAPAVSFRDEFEFLKKSGMAREVILEVEIPPGPMGIILDHTIQHSAVLARYAPLPSGQKGYIEVHPAICPGCLLVAVNGSPIEHLSLADLGPVLASTSMCHRLLTFKKFMVGSRVVHPIKLKNPYTPPPPENEAILISPPSPVTPAPPSLEESSSVAMFRSPRSSYGGSFPPQDTYNSLRAASQQGENVAFQSPQHLNLFSPQRHPQPAPTTGFSFLAASPSQRPQSPKPFTPPPQESSSGFTFISQPTASSSFSFMQSHVSPKANPEPKSTSAFSFI